MTFYANDLSTWEEWQTAYCFGVILVLPPPDVAEPVDALRKKFDPRSFAVSQAHISVSDPLSGPLTRELREEIALELAKVQPFELRIHQPRASNDFAGVFCPVSPQEPIESLKQILHSCSAFAESSHERRHIPAHMTIAEFLSIEESNTICNRLSLNLGCGSFMCEHLTYLVPDQQFRFQIRDTFFLGHR